MECPLGQEVARRLALAVECQRARGVECPQVPVAGFLPVQAADCPLVPVEVFRLGQVAVYRLVPAAVCPQDLVAACRRGRILT